ncbi:MAG: glycosyltransferase [Ignavibacteriae bacterium]|nr:glycosyltransferase [Ignavibacteriota bacterium]
MKIAYVHTGKWPSNSPSFTFATNNAVALAQEFEECFLFVKNNSEKTSDEIINNELNISFPKNLTIIRFANNSIINTNYFYYRNVFKTLKKLIRQNNVDIVITRNPTFLKYLIKIKLKFKIKVYFETHDFYANLKLRDDINHSKKRKIEKIENKFIPRIDGVICLQNSQKELYEEHFPNVNIFVTRTGLRDIENINHEKKYVTYIGSLDKHKGVDQLIQAAAQSRSKPEILIIGGKTEFEVEETKNIISNYYNPDYVKITGWINKKEMSEYLAKTAIGIIPLENTFFNKYLTSPLKLFDYYSFCIPVIASDLPSTRELIIEAKTGLFFGSVSDLADKIDELLLSNCIIDEMRNNIQEYAQKFLWINRAKELKKIFNLNSKSNLIE